MKAATFVCLMAFATIAHAQSNDEMMTEMEGKWKTDTTGLVTYSKTISVPKLKKDVVFVRSQSFFKAYYGTPKCPIQTDDKVKGCIVAKGMFDTVHVGVSTITTHINTNYILKTEVTDGKATITLTLTDYEKKIIDPVAPTTISTMKVEQEYPVNPNGRLKTVMIKAFYKSHKKALASLEALEKTIMDGILAKPIAVN